MRAVTSVAYRAWTTDLTPDLTADWVGLGIGTIDNRSQSWLTDYHMVVRIKIKKRRNQTKPHKTTQDGCNTRRLLALLYLLPVPSSLSSISHTHTISDPFLFVFCFLFSFSLSIYTAPPPEAAAAASAATRAATFSSASKV